MTDVIWGSTKKPVASQRLATLVEREFPEEGFLYVGYPVLAGSEGVNSIDALWISPAHGIVIFHLIEGRDLGNFQDVQDEFANNLEVKLRLHRSLMRGRDLLARPVVVTYAPLVKLPEVPDPNYPAANDGNVIALLSSITWDRPELYQAAHSVLQSISSIRKGRKRRSVVNEGSRAAKLKELEDSIANLDSLQSRAVIETVEGVQRIRGLAGSGKTIVLALKAAYLHAQHPEWKIAVTFNTRSLKGQFVRLIETFVVEQTGELPDWENVQVLNAWGAPGGSSRTGVYYQFCQANGVEFFDFQAARNRFRGKEFDKVCELAIEQTKSPKKLFDTILVDEAQDFDPSFLQLCYLSLGDVKRLVYAYDELQSLTDTTLPPPEELFGTNPDGGPRVQFRPPLPGEPSQDIILEKCYRNSGPVLATAHALGFGIYRTPDPKTGTGLIQMFDNATLWEDVGYKVIHGELKDDVKVVLARTEASSPAFLERPAEIDPLIQFICFETREEQTKFIADSIESNLKRDELQHTDIIVINPDPLTTVKQAGPPRKILFERGIQSHVAGVDTNSDVFFKTEEDSVAFTGIFRAKGNEAGMVYIMNAQDCYDSYGHIGRVRNQLFTAITRSKAWVKVLGYGPNMVKLTEEFEQVAKHNFRLEFVYPNEELRKHLKVINRDLSKAEQDRIRGAVSGIEQLNADIEAGNVLIEDLPRAELLKLQKLISAQLRQ